MISRLLIKLLAVEFFFCLVVGAPKKAPTKGARRDESETEGIFFPDPPKGPRRRENEREGKKCEQQHKPNDLGAAAPLLRRCSADDTP